jgi:hypothetical protein
MDAATVRARVIVPTTPSWNGLNTSSAPNARRIRRRSSVALSGITSTHRYPRTAHNAASEIPVLPDVASTTVTPARNTPDRSADRIMCRAARSFTLDNGLNISNLASSRAGRSG